MKEPCQRCIEAAHRDVIDREAIQPLRSPVVMNAVAACWLGPDGRGYHCTDCDVAETMRRMSDVMTWDMARTCVGQVRRDAYRLPATLKRMRGTGDVMGLMRDSDFEDVSELYDWLDEAVPGEWG